VIVMDTERFCEYRIMWLFVFFDLPVETKKEMRVASDFRKTLLRDGFIMFQFSVYVRHCPSKENADVHLKRVKAMIPSEGQVCILTVTDKQFGEMVRFIGNRPRPPEVPGMQLEFF
jgi:CRISPR-associated protein Cas2